MIALDTRLDQLSALVDGWTHEFLRTVDVGVRPFQQMIAYHLGWAGSDLQPLPRPVSAGKRLRPALCLLVAEAVCGRLEPAAAAAVALELVHNFSLVHDDIQDQSDLRRHRPTIWALWGEAQAINVGDGLFALAQLALTSPCLPLPRAEVTVQAAAHLNRTCLALVEGQFLDLELQRAEEVSLADYQRMVAGKTAALFQCACELGALYAGAPAGTLSPCGAFGHQLGLAFQYQDDLLGAWGQSAATGKPEAGDLRSKKKGLPAVLAFETLRGPDAARLRALYRSPGDLDDAGVAEVLALLERWSIHAGAERLVERGYAEALQELARIAPSGSPPPALVALCQRLQTRQA
ncbi:MAG: polyprenyl synthetase family protein [Chloroflexi bacterium]|nr:polyprenyl synthetase family protein [Chloroflexota bacterium]